ncbi:M protein trans-acting positive regulator PRD domain-containing protein [Streptococcus nidrosiense]|uniref:M protein trans-acting positive regulator PRD domain-containing protein n=1 Tax=Streptococcus nidrosiense TaxID=3140788 RepID=UPI0035CF1E1E
MRTLLTQKEQRQLRVLEYLFENPSWIHLDPLAEALDINTRIIKSDIKEMRDVLSCFEIQSSTAGIRLTNNGNLGIERIYRHALQNSSNFQVLKAFFLLEAPFTYEHLAQTLDVSLPALRKKVAEINSVLQNNYRFKLKVTPISIIGDERDIRFFFAQYFHEAYGYFKWPFTDSKEDIEGFVRFFLDMTGFPASYANLFQIETLVAVNLHRFRIGATIQTASDSSNVLPLYDQLSEFKNQLDPLAKRLNIEINRDTLDQLFYSYTQKGIFFTVEEFLDARLIDKQVNRSYHAARDVLDNLTREFGVHFSNTDELVWHLHNTALLERQEINSESIISHNKSYALNKIKKFFPEFYEASVFEMMRYKSSLGQDEHAYAVVHLVYTLFTHTSNLMEQLLEAHSNIRVLVLSEFDFAHPHALISLYTFYTSKNIQFETWDKDTLNVDEIMDADYDAILTNFDIDGLKHPNLINIGRMSNLQVINELNTISIAKL